MSDTDRFIEAIQTSPRIKTFLLKCAKRAARGARLPATMSIPEDVSYEEQRELACFFLQPVARRSDGSVRVFVPERLRDPVAWSGILVFLGLDAKEPGGPGVSETLQRAELIHGGAPFVADAAERPEIVRFLKDPDNGPKWLKLYGWVRGRWLRHDHATTLSQLGADLFGDSKALRTGGLRRQLMYLLEVFDRSGIEDERVLMAQFGIADNPYTSHVTVFAPFEFRLRDGSEWDFPRRLFERGKACQLPLETVEGIEEIHWTGGRAEIVTSENAAPFARLVGEGTASLYTEGYPNFAVRKLLGRFSGAGVKAVHAGDADLDGFRIAEQIGGCISVLRTIASDVLSNPSGRRGIPMDDAQRKRLGRYRERAGLESPYCEEYALLERRGCWYEQESFHEA